MNREEAELTIEYLKGIQEEYIEGEGYERHPLPEWYALDKAIEVIEQESKAGHWIEKDGFDGDVYYDCSECGESFCLIDGTPADNLYNYCPNCGAKMEESEDKI